MTETTQSALSGIRVLDFTRVLAGPLATMMMGDLGADIIKVEHPKYGDDTRAWGPPWAGDAEKRQSAYFLSVNRNKRSLALNLKTQQGQELARQLAAQSHVLVENFKHGQMDKFGLSYQDLHTLNPGLVYCSITGFGQTGPYCNRPGYDYVIQAMSGLMSITGPAEEPFKVGVAVSDVFTALYACNAIQAALRHAEHTGEGQYIDLALLDSQLAALVNVASNTLVSGEDSPRYGNQHPNIVPYQTFRASDGEFVVAVGNDRQFVLLCDLIDRSDLCDDPRFATNPARVSNRGTLIDILGPIFQAQTTSDWVDALLALGIPAGPINTMQSALNDVHIAARDMIEEVQLPDGTAAQLVASPLRLSETPVQTRLPPPEIGQHSDVILQELLNLDSKQLQRLRDEGVVR